MDLERLRRHIKGYVRHIHEDPVRHEQASAERRERAEYYQAWTAERLRAITEDELYEYVAELWAVLIWGNKQYVVAKLIEDNGFKSLKDELAELVWGEAGRASSRLRE